MVYCTPRITDRGLTGNRRYNLIVKKRWFREPVVELGLQVEYEYTSEHPSTNPHRPPDPMRTYTAWRWAQVSDVHELNKLDLPPLIVPNESGLDFSSARSALEPAVEQGLTHRTVHNVRMVKDYQRLILHVEAFGFDRNSIVTWWRKATVQDLHTLLWNKL